MPKFFSQILNEKKFFFICSLEYDPTSPFDK